MQAYLKSVGGEPDKRFQRIYLADREIVWPAILEALKSFPIDISNHESGVIQTKWTDNTSEANLSDNFGGNPVYLKAQFRYRVNLMTGSYQGKSAIKVTVQKEQLVNQDVLDGWKKVTTNGVEEKTLLYRLGRLVYMKMVLAQEEERKLQKDIEDSKKSISSDENDFSLEEPAPNSTKKIEPETKPESPSEEFNESELDAGFEDESDEFELID